MQKCKHNGMMTDCGLRPAIGYQGTKFPGNGPRKLASSSVRLIQRPTNRRSHSFIIFSRNANSSIIKDGESVEEQRDFEGRNESPGRGQTVAKLEGKRGRRDEKVVEVAVAAVVSVVLGVGNRVLTKLALVPLRHYPFFLAQIATIGYVIAYFTILYARYHAGIITDDMLSISKSKLVLVGFLEALGAATGMAAAAILSGASIPILSQTFLMWQIVLSMAFLRRRYKTSQLLGCCLAAIGVIITVASGSISNPRENAIFWNLLMIFSFLLQAADSVLKGGSVDIFVVNSFGSAFQALFLCLIIPLMSKLWGTPFSQLPLYLKDGAACFLNVGNSLRECDGAPLLPFLFVIVNIAFNISLLHLLKISSAVVSSLASLFSVPIAVYMFSLRLPYLEAASALPTGFVAGTVILLLGLLVYTWASCSTEPVDSSPCTATLLHHPPNFIS